LPAAQNVKSHTRKAFGRSAVKSRPTRSSGPSASGSLLVVRHGCPRRFAPGSHARPSAAAPGSARHARRRAPAPSTSACTRTPRSCARALRGSPPAAAHPRSLSRTAHRRPAGKSGRRHAQGPADRLDPEALAMLLDIRAHLVRSLSSSLAKHRSGLGDLVRSAQLLVLLRQPADLLTLLAPEQIRPLAAVGLRLAHTLTQRLRMDPTSAAICAIGRPDSNTSRTPRSINSSGYFLGRGMNTEFLSRGPKSSSQGLRQTGPAHVGSCLLARHPPLLPVGAPPPYERDRSGPANS
jgi:hypothetical protein